MGKRKLRELESVGSNPTSLTRISVNSRNAETLMTLLPNHSGCDKVDPRLTSERIRSSLVEYDSLMAIRRRLALEEVRAKLGVATGGIISLLVAVSIGIRMCDSK